MSKKSSDFWPEFHIPDTMDSPVFLLKEQAAQLQRKTKGLVTAGLRPASLADGSFWVGFDLSSPALGEYSYRLFSVTYSPEKLFPITVNAGDETKTAADLKAFKILLSEVLSSPRTRQIVEAIMAQAAALGPPVEV